MAALGCLPVIWASNLLFFKSAVVNISDPELFRTESPKGFIWQDPNSSRLQAFRSELPDALKLGKPSLQKAIAICHWVRIQQPDGESWSPHQITFKDRLRGDSEDPIAILQAQRNGFPAVCKRFAYLMVGAAASAGMKARIVTVSYRFLKSYWEGHVMAEIWVPELQKWVLMDPMWDLMFVTNATPASAMDVYDAARAGKMGLVHAIHNGKLQEIADPATVKKRFQHLYIAMSNAVFDGYRVCFACEKPITFAHLTNEFSPNYPTALKGIAVALGSLTAVSGLIIVLLSMFEFAKQCSVGHSWQGRPGLSLSQPAGK